MVPFTPKLEEYGSSCLFRGYSSKSERNNVTGVRTRLLQCRSPALLPLHYGNSLHPLCSKIHIFTPACPYQSSISNVLNIVVFCLPLLIAILNKSWRQHATKYQLYGHLPPITKTIQVRRTRHAGHCWRSRDELISDVLLWTPTYGRAKAGRPARTYIQQLCEDTGCSPEDLPEAMNDREKWWEKVRDIRVGGTTWFIYKSSNFSLKHIWLNKTKFLLKTLPYYKKKKTKLSGTRSISNVTVTFWNGFNIFPPVCPLTASKVLLFRKFPSLLLFFLVFK